MRLARRSDRRRGAVAKRAARALACAAVVGATVTLGCAGAGTGAQVAVSDRSPGSDLSSVLSGELVRRVAPFTVSGEDGEPYALPFLGGMNVPRPQWVDLDGDSDLDLVVQEYTGRLLVFEHLPSEGGGVEWAFRPDLLADLDVGEWYRFVDVDADGDPDLLGESPFSYVRLFRNRGSGAHVADFELAADTLRDIAGQPIFSDRQNIPNAGDIDCDARLDLLLGRTIGTITHYEATEAMGPGVPRFAKVTDRFEGIEIVGVAGPRPPPGGSRHGANTMALADHDGDGDLDLFWGDFFEPGLLLIENSGSCESPVLTGEPRPFPLDDPVRTSGYNAPTFGDVDGDGDLDLLVGVLGGAFNANTTTVDNLLHVERTPGAYRLRTSRYLTQLDVGNESVPSLVDLDGDDDLDLLVANKIDANDLATSVIYHFENTGETGEPSFRLRGTLEVPGAYHNAPAFGDLDGDDDLDLLLGTWRNELRFFRNEGSGTEPRWVLEDSAFVVLTRGSNAMPALGDLDDDGDLDLLVGESSGTINFYRNEGSTAEPRFELVSDEWAGIKAERRSAPALADLDGDGDLDLLLGTEREGVRLWLNEGGRSEPHFVEMESLLSFSEASPFTVPSPADLDGDGDLDLVVGGLGGGLYYFERTQGR